MSSLLTIIYSGNFRTQGKADTINLEQLITFLNEKQRDPTLNEILYPLYDEKRALEIINDYEQNETARNQSKPKKRTFSRNLFITIFLFLFYLSVSFSIYVSIYLSISLYLSLLVFSRDSLTL